MILKRGILILIFTSIAIQSVIAAYEVKGKVNISSGWQHQIFLSTINKLDDYYDTNPENIIQVGAIESDGSFYLKGDNLPVDQRFYRLYTIKEENSEFDACIYFDEADHNFIHLILDNETKVEIGTDAKQMAPFSNYEIKGNAANIELRKLSKLIFPSFYFHQIKFPSELQFSKQKLNRDLFSFIDSSEHILVALAAIINTDMDENFEIDSQKYLDFGGRLSNELNNHSYTEDYFRKINYYNGDYEKSNSYHWLLMTIGILSLLLFLAVFKIYNLIKRIEKLSESKINTQSILNPSFTKQEQKILSLILAEKSNKEIASELFIEVSTVKTHINKLYGKLGAKSRSEAKTIAKSFDIERV